VNLEPLPRAERGSAAYETAALPLSYRGVAAVPGLEPGTSRARTERAARIAPYRIDLLKRVGDGGLEPPSRDF
jgi:hypothetical protein